MTMRANHVNKNSIQLRDEDIEDVEQFTYLGSVVSRESGTDRNIKSRIGKATAAFKGNNNKDCIKSYYITSCSIFPFSQHQKMH